MEYPGHNQPRPFILVLSGLGVGGNETHAVTLLSRIDRRQLAPFVVSLTADTGPTEDALKLIGVPVIRIPINATGKVVFIRRFAAVVREIGAVAVLCAGLSKYHLYVHGGALLGGAVARISRASDSPPDPKLRRKMKLLQWASRLVCTHEVAVSEAVAVWLKSFGGYPDSRIHVIPNGCDVAHIYSRAESRRQITQEYPRSVIMVARLDGAKDHETLFYAMAKVRKHLPDVELLVVGDGQRRQTLEALAWELDAGVHFLGNRDDVPELLGSASAFVLSTYSEGMPNALIEAMAARLPVIASDIPPCREVLSNGRFGLLFPVGDAEALSVHLIAVLQDDAEIFHWGELAGAGAEHFRLEASVNAYEDLILHAI